MGTRGVDPAWHGTDGPVPLRRPAPEELSPWQRAFGEACVAEGFPACPDTNAPGATGYGIHAFNRIDGQRWNTARSYLTAEVRARRTLTVWPGTLVRRALFEGRRCVGLEVDAGGRVATVRSRRVVLSGGVMATPGILLRSGVGPDAAVRRVGATPLVEVPAVGASSSTMPAPRCSSSLGTRRDRI